MPSERKVAVWTDARGCQKLIKKDRERSDTTLRAQTIEGLWQSNLVGIQDRVKTCTISVWRWKVGNIYLTAEAERSGDKLVKTEDLYQQQIERQYGEVIEKHCC